MPLAAVWPLAATLAYSASAQGVGDTLHYHERTENETVVTSTRGVATTRGEHDAVLAFVRLSSDSAHAWYESLSIVSSTNAGEVRPDVSSVGGRPFVLRFDRRGHVRTLATPAFPEALRGITDLRLQFSDFFMPTPPERLRTGLTWSDTLAADLGGDGGARGEIRSAVRYTVLRDTAIASETGFVVAAAADVALWLERPLPSYPHIVVRTALAGPDSSTFVVGSRGQLLSRTRTGELTGAVTYTGMPAPLEMPLRRSSRSTIELRVP